MTQTQILPANDLKIPTPIGTSGFQPSLAIEKLVQNFDIWNYLPEPIKLPMQDGSELPALLYPPKKPNFPKLVVVTTAQSICKEDTPACLSEDKKTLYIGQDELDRTSYINKLLYPKKEALNSTIQERIQRGVIGYQLELVSSNGDLYQAYVSFLKTVYDKEQKPKEILQLIFRSRPLEDYLFAVLCYGEINKKEANEFLLGGRNYKDFVKNSINEERSKLPTLEEVATNRIDPSESIGRVARRRKELTTNSKYYKSAYGNAQEKFNKLIENGVK